MLRWVAVLASLTTGIVTALQENVWDLSTQADPQNDFVLSRSLARVAGLRTVVAVTAENADNKQNTSQHALSCSEHGCLRETTILPRTSHEQQIRFTKRMLGSSPPSLSPQKSSGSWSNASSGTKRKVEQQPLHTDLTWGQLKTRTGSGPVDKIPNSATPPKGPLSSTREVSTSQNKSNILGHALLDHKSDNRNTPTYKERSQSPATRESEKSGVLVRTTEERKRRAQKQKLYREEQKRKIEEGSPEAIRERKRYNARRRERRIETEDPISSSKIKTHEKELSKNRSAVYRARQKGQIEPRKFLTSEAHRAKERERMRLRKERLKDMAADDTQPGSRRRRKTAFSDESTWQDEGESSGDGSKRFEKSIDLGKTRSRSPISLKHRAQHGRSERIVPMSSRQQSRELSSRPAQHKLELTRATRQASSKLLEEGELLLPSNSVAEPGHDASKALATLPHKVRTGKSAKVLPADPPYALPNELALPSRSDSPLFFPSSGKEASPFSPFSIRRSPSPSPKFSNVFPLEQSQDEVSGLSQAHLSRPPSTDQLRQQLPQLPPSEEIQWWTTPLMSPLSYDSTGLRSPSKKSALKDS